MSESDTYVRGAMLTWFIDKMGEIQEELHNTEGRTCADCPFLGKLLKIVRTAQLQERDNVADLVGDFYGA